MNNAVFAIPGLMPPKAPNYTAKYTAPEDGSLKMLLYIGVSTDKVYFSLNIPGILPGTINDPQYYEDKDYPEKVLEHTDQYAQFLHKYTELPTDAIVPYKVVQDWPIPITEWSTVPTADRNYWVIELPVRVLPIGDTEIQVSANNAVTNYIVNRPYFGAHNRGDDISMRYAKYKDSSDVATDSSQS